MGRRKLGVGVQEGQKFAPGGPGPGIHLAAATPGRRQQAQVGETARQFPGAVGAAAIHQDDFHVGRNRQPS